MGWLFLLSLTSAEAVNDSCEAARVTAFEKAVLSSLEACTRCCSATMRAAWNCWAWTSVCELTVSTTVSSILVRLACRLAKLSGSTCWIVDSLAPAHCEMSDSLVGNSETSGALMWLADCQNAEAFWMSSSDPGSELLHVAGSA